MGFQQAGFGGLECIDLVVHSSQASWVAPVRLGVQGWGCGWLRSWMVVGGLVSRWNWGEGLMRET